MSTSESSPRRVLHVLPALGKEGQLGGAERVAVELMKKLRTRSDWEVQLCVIGPRDPHHPSYGLDEEPLFLEVANVHLSPRNALLAIHRLKQLFGKWPPRIAHSHLWPADMICAAAGSRANILHIAHLHDVRPLTRSEGRTRAIRRALYRWLLKRAQTRFVACAETVKKEFCSSLGFDNDHVEVIRNGLDESWLRTDERRIPPRTEFLVGYAARLQRGKGHELLIGAVAEISKEIPGLRLLLAGDGVEKAALYEQARSLGIDERVVFLGRVREMRAFYDNLDVYVCPSHSEGLPVSVLEAMARGLPVVATEVGGIPEIIRGGMDGILVPAGNVQALASAIKRLAANPDLRQVLGNAARERIRSQFLIDRMVEALCRYYERILAQA